MNLATQIHNGIYDVTIGGQFTFGDHTAFRIVLEKIEGTEVQRTNVNMEKVDFVDSAALGMLLLALETSQKHNKKIILCGATGQVRKMFELAHFDTLFN